MFTQIIAQIELKNCAPDAPNKDGCLTTLPTTLADKTSLVTVLSVVFGVLAALAVIIIIVQAIRFVMSKGEPDKVAEARRGIIYAVVGLGVALSAELIVNVVIGRL